MRVVPITVLKATARALMPEYLKVTCDTQTLSIEITASPPGNAQSPARSYGTAWFIGAADKHANFNGQ